MREMQIVTIHFLRKFAAVLSTLECFLNIVIEKRVFFCLTRRLIVICTTSNESHTFFHDFASKEVKKETFITCCTHYFFAYRCMLRNLVQKDL
jgi:hypothetical protein